MRPAGGGSIAVLAFVLLVSDDGSGGSAGTRAEGGTFECAPGLVADDGSGPGSKKRSGGGSTLGVRPGGRGAAREEQDGGKGGADQDVFHGVVSGCFRMGDHKPAARSRKGSITVREIGVKLALAVLFLWRRNTKAVRLRCPGVNGFSLWMISRAAHFFRAGGNLRNLFAGRSAVVSWHGECFPLNCCDPQAVRLRCHLEFMGFLRG